MESVTVGQAAGIAVKIMRLDRPENEHGVIEMARDEIECMHVKQLHDAIRPYLTGPSYVEVRGIVIKTNLTDIEVQPLPTALPIAFRTAPELTGSLSA